MGPSIRAGMGAIPYDHGVTFRVWAPFAKNVAVAGDFNGWSDKKHPLVREADGTWSLDVDDVAAGNHYEFVVDGSWRMDPQAREVTNSAGDSVVEDRSFEWQATKFRMPPWNELVIYEMHVGTFPDKPTSARKLFDAVINDLEYLVKLGVNAIELLPTQEFPTDQSWGYNPSNIFAVESYYGGPSGLKRLIDAAHGKGIAVILDVVYNHFGPTDLSLWQFDGWFERWNGEPMGGIYFYNDWRAWTPWGSKNRPDYGRPEVRSFIRDNAMMWLEEFRADGLRFDATNYIRSVRGGELPIDDPANLSGWGWNLMRWVNDEVDRLQSWKITIAEDMQGNEAVTRRTSDGGAGFDAQWDAGFHHELLSALTRLNDEDRSMSSIRALIDGRLGPDAFSRIIFSESHDEVASSNGKRRVPDAIAPGNAEGWFAQKRSTLGAALVMTTPGIPMIFQGQELLEWAPFGDQTRMDWDRYDRFLGIYHLYRDLILLRRNASANTRGLSGRGTNVFHVNDRDKVVAFHRWEDGGAGDDVVVVLNFGNRGYDSYSIGLPRSGMWRVRFNSDSSDYSSIFNNHASFDTAAGEPGRDGLPFSGNVGLGPYSAIVLSQ